MEEQAGERQAMNDRFKDMDDKMFIFGTLFVVANKLNTLMDRELKPFGMTSKQWLLSVVIDTLFDDPPTIKQVAKEMGSSHQNVKQVALKLERKGMLKLEKDSEDLRATRLRLTRKAYDFWDGIHQKGEEFFDAVFSETDVGDLRAARRAVQSVWSNLSRLEHK